MKKLIIISFLFLISCGDDPTTDNTEKNEAVSELQIHFIDNEVINAKKLIASLEQEYVKFRAEKAKIAKEKMRLKALLKNAQTDEKKDYNNQLSALKKKKKQLSKTLRAKKKTLFRTFDKNFFGHIIRSYYQFPKEYPNPRLHVKEPSTNQFWISLLWDGENKKYQASASLRFIRDENIKKKAWLSESISVVSESPSSIVLVVGIFDMRFNLFNPKWQEQMTAKEAVQRFFNLPGIAKIQANPPRQFVASDISLPEPWPKTLKMINPRGSGKVNVKSLGNNQFVLSPSSFALAGMYYLDNKRLIMRKPATPRNKISTWELQGEDYFVQTANKKYLGNILRFNRE